MRRTGAVALLAATAALIAAAGRCDEKSPLAKPRPYEFVYQQKCAACHGSDGRGVDSLYQKLDVKKGVLDLTRDEVAHSSHKKIANVIRMGNGKMPGFGQKFHEDAIDGLARYVRSLSEGPAEARGNQEKTPRAASKTGAAPAAR